MQVSKTVTIPNISNYSVNVDVKHPASLQEMTHLEHRGLTFALGVFPETETAPAHVTLSVFVEGQQHVIFNGDVASAKTFFERFPKN